MRAQLKRGRKFLHHHLRRRYRRSGERQGYRDAPVRRRLRSRAQGQDFSRHRRRRPQRRRGGHRQRRSAVARFCREGVARLSGAGLQGRLARFQPRARQDPAIRQGLRDVRRCERRPLDPLRPVAAMPRRRRSTAPRTSARSRPGRRSSPISRPASTPIWPAPISRSSDRARRPTTPAASLLAEADASCKDQSKLRSQNSKTPIKLTFINRSGAMRGILWLDFDGQPKDYANLSDRERVTLDTFLTHPWMVTDGPGNCLRIVLRKSRRSRSSSSAAGATRASARRRPRSRWRRRSPAARKASSW